MARGGHDTLYCGQGADSFVFSLGSGNDTIGDYDAQDVIRITSGAASLADLTFTDTAAGLRVEFGNVDIFLTGLDRADLDASDFDFV